MTDNLEVVETKLCILIDDFREFKSDQKKEHKAIEQRIVKESNIESKILTTLQYHTLIGSFIVGVVMYILYKGM